jgi:hypothetical protein
LKLFLPVLLLTSTLIPVAAEEIGSSDLLIDDALGGFDSEESVDNLLGGFDENGFEEGEFGSSVESELSLPENSVSAIRGHWVTGSSWNIAGSSPTADRLTRLSTKLWLESEQDLGGGWKLHGDGFLRYDLAYSINGRNQYTGGVVDGYEQDAEIGEFWVRGSLTPDLDLKVGRQVVVWGQSDYLRVNDVLNPLDLREPGLVDIETLRRPIGMLKTDYYQGDWRWSALLISENRPNLSAPCGSEYSLAGVVTQASCDSSAVPVELSDDGLSDAEYALSAMGRFSGWDLSLYAGRLNYDTPYKDAAGANNVMRNARVSHLGAAINIAEGSWLWKGELALVDGLRYFNTGAAKKSRFDLLLGGEYRGITNSTLSFEVLRRHINGYESSLTNSTDFQDESSWQSVLGYTRDLRNDTIHLKGVILRNGNIFNDGGYLRLSTKYDLRDQWSVTGGGIWYDATKYRPDWSDNDRLFIEARRDF